jgi:hypothetical protein
MKLVIVLLSSCFSLVGCTTSQPVSHLQLCILASCNSSPVVDRIGSPKAVSSTIEEDIKQDNISKQKGETSAESPL